jgi:prephenate dehydratase
VRHALLAPRGATLDGLRDVFSHAAALSQCAGFLARHPRLTARAAYDTAGAAREVAARGSRAEGALAGLPCADRYGLDVLATGVNDRDDNATRFAVVMRPADAGEA